MNETNLHFKIKEYIMKISFKKDLIVELNEELQRLNKIKNELLQNKEDLKEEYKRFEKQKKIIINSSKISNEPNNIKQLNLNNKFNKNIGIKSNIKRNFSAAKPKRKLEINHHLIDLRKQNYDLEDNLINYNHELNNIIQTVNEMEIKCKLLMIKADKQTNLIEIQKK